MTLFFIESSKEKNRFKLKIKNILNKIEEKQYGNNILFTLPIKINSKIKDKKISKMINKIDKNRVKTVVLSEELYGLNNIKNQLYSKNINILEGSYLFKLLTQEIISFLSKKTYISIEKAEISILTNDASNVNKQIIIELAEKVKTLNIITNHISEFKNLEEYLCNEKGIIIKLSNNYKTALLKTNIIINMDFAENVINKYVIPSKCIIINIKGRVKIDSKKYNGININGYNIIMPKRYKIQGYNNNHVYEAHVINLEYEKARKKVLEDKIIIKNLIGEKGVINNREYIRIK